MKLLEEALGAKKFSNVFFAVDALSADETWWGKNKKKLLKAAEQVDVSKSGHVTQKGGKKGAGAVGDCF